jgi:hypothetical protein
MALSDVLRCGAFLVANGVQETRRWLTGATDMAPLTRFCHARFRISAPQTDYYPISLVAVSCFDGRVES